MSCIKINDLVKGVNKSIPCEIDWDSINDEMGIYEYTQYYDDENSKRLKCYYSQVWYCTDTWVGLLIYFLDDKPVAISEQPARKSDKSFKWIDYNTTYDFVHELFKNYKNIPTPTLIKLDDVYDNSEYYNVFYSSQLLHDRVWYEDKLCKVIRNYNSNSYVCKEIVIDFDNTEKIVNISDCKIKYNQPIKYVD